MAWHKARLCLVPGEFMEPVNTLFKRHFGHKPPHVARAPGRLELLGNHTDYNAGLVAALGYAVSRLAPVDTTRFNRGVGLAPAPKVRSRSGTGRRVDGLGRNFWVTGREGLPSVQAPFRVWPVPR